MITMEMKHEIIDTAPSAGAAKEIFRTYSELGVIVNRLSEYLKDKGYNAQAGSALGGDANYPVLAQNAGLGHTGKHGLLITPEFGPSLRIAAVYTDITNLPISEYDEHKWIEKFCADCNLCVKRCPAQAINKASKVQEDLSKVCIDYKKCAIPFSMNYNCTICVKSCAFFKGDYEKIKARY